MAVRLAAELRANEYNRAGEMLEYHSRLMCDNSANNAILKAVIHDVITASRDRDFRFWSLFSGEVVGGRDLCIRIAELNTRDTRTRVYNYQKRKR